MSDQIKIFLLTDSLNSLQGGAERQIYEFIKNLDRSKYKIYLGCLSRHDGALDDMQNLNIEIFRFQVDRIYDFKGIWQGFKFAQLLKREQIGALITYHFGSDIWGTIFGKMAGVSRIVSNRRDMGFWRNVKHVYVYKIINRWVDKIVVVSKAIKDIVMREECVKDEKIKVIYNGINLERFEGHDSEEKCLQELNLSDDAKVIGCVGNLREVKGHKYLIDAAKMVVDEKVNTHFVLIGRGDLQDALQEQINQLGLQKNVHLLGSRTDVPKLIKAMDICVLPSLSEGLSNTLLEYMACGKPIVATKVGGNPEVILDGTNGLLVNKESSKELADQLLFLLNDQNECQRLGVKAKEDVKKRFNIQAMVEQYENLLNSEIG